MNLLGKKQLTSLIVILLLSLAGFIALNYEQQAEARDPSRQRNSGLNPKGEKKDEERGERSKPETIYGTPEDDTIVTFKGHDRILAMGGNDYVFSGPGNDVVNGNDGNDHLYGESGNDSLYGDNGNDGLYGGPGNDVLKGEAGNDFMHGGDGEDDLYSRGGSDFMFGGDGADDFIIRPSNAVEYNAIIDFTPGVDRIDVSHAGIHLVDFADLLTHCVQTSNGVKIWLPTNNWGSDMLMLFGVTIADLDPLDFDI